MSIQLGPPAHLPCARGLGLWAVKDKEAAVSGVFRFYCMEAGRYQDLKKGPEGLPFQIQIGVDCPPACTRSATGSHTQAVFLI